jgi:hypothetical protein
MAPKTAGSAVATQDASSTAVAPTMSDDVRADLLRAQQASLGDDIDLPRIKVAGAAAGVFQFPDDGIVMQEFSGVILGAHARNVLWTRAADDASEEDSRPACSSEDGKFGRPQEGFVHANLGRAASGDEYVKCTQCVYNKFGTGATFIATKKPKGKAVQNQKAVYIYLPDRNLPFVLTLSSMAIAGFDEYVTKLLRRGVPIQSIVTTFRQTIKDGPPKYAVPTFHDGEPLGADAFNEVMRMRADFIAKIEPAPPVQKAEATVVEADVTDPTHEERDGDDPPFSVEDASKIPVGDKPPF